MASIALDVIVHEKYIEKSWIHFKLIGNSQKEKELQQVMKEYEWGMVHMAEYYCVELQK